MQSLRIFLGDSLYYIFTFLFFVAISYICSMENNTQEKTINIRELEDFWNETVDQFHTRPDEDPLTVEMIIKALKGFIDLKKK